MATIQSKEIQRQYSRARLARDARFDGVFFTAVTTTGIYCRSICPAKPPLEKNVEYHDSSISAAEAGFRPCLRCRPDSAPDSSAWLGRTSTVQKAIKLIQSNALHESSIEALAETLGISSRYLRQLFKQQFGISPKRFALHQQCLFAKKLLHETDMPITQIAFASGFGSIRRFNETIQEQLQLSPTEIRKKALIMDSKTIQSNESSIKLNLSYRPPFKWNQILDFLKLRLIAGLEWVENDTYGRTFQHKHFSGYFSIKPNSNHHSLEVTIQSSDDSQLLFITQKIKELFDLNTPINSIDKQLKTELKDFIMYQDGLRIPGVWSGFEAGIRAILGQQVSVKQAHVLIEKLVKNLGESVQFTDTPAQHFFPKPEQVEASSLDFFRMPQARKDTLRRLANHVLTTKKPDDFDAWLSLKGIGQWTVNYVKLRAAKDPDIWLTGDAGVKNALKKISHEIDIDAMRPWRSYLVFQLWNQL